ncbi:hypothetical protein [Halospeciosus flavus]|uniref:DUF7827 domain-containing protein n=1 Tax=Halospeciosus flavus TaxID=3032283 RepID=A0ABD5Z4S8_9EURY|nr:hypothetical protein [Halospeciosus flavus]
MAATPIRETTGLVVVLFVVLAAVPPAVAVDTADPATVAFEQTSYETERGDLARLSVNFAETRSGTLTIVAPDGDTANVTVSDGNRDWQATLLLNTYARGPDGRFGTPNDADYTYVHDAFDESGRLPAGEYEVRLRAGYGMNSPVVATVPLRVREPAAPNVSVAVAPEGAYDDLSSPTAIRSGPVTSRGTVAVNDTLVLRLNASGIEGALAVQEGSTPTERFESLLAEPGYGLAAVQTNPGPSYPGKYLRLFGPGTRFVGDAVNDSYYVVVDTARVETYLRHSDDVTAPPFRADDRYRVNATTSNRTATDRFVVVEREVSFVSPPATRFVRPAANQSVWFTSSLAPGSALTVVAEPTNNSTTRSTVRTSVRTTSGRFAATLDANEFAENTTLNVSAVDDGRVLAHANVSVETPEATLDVTEVTNGSAAEVAFEADVSHPSVVVAHRGDASGAVLGSAAVFPDDDGDTVPFEPTWSGRSTVTLVAYADVDSDGTFDPAVDVRYPSDSAVARTVVSSTVATTTTERTTTRPTTSEPVPGFGVGAALVALLGVLVATLVGAHREK